MIHLDKRLSLMAEMMTKDGFGIDVGTDHGYLAVALIQQGRAEKMIASDINEAPLASAESCIRENGLSDRITTVLTNGLIGIDLSEITDIFIAGMGGILISEILSARLPDILDKNLVLQPMTQAPALRTWLSENGFAILEERCALVAGKAYSIIHARYNGVSFTPDGFYALVGKTSEDTSPDGTAYLQVLYDRQKKILRGLLQSENADPDKMSEIKATVEKLDRLLASEEKSR